MATERKLVCTICQSSVDVGALFEALQLLATNSITQCPSCSGKRQLHLGFDFGLDAGGNDSVALAAFLPRRVESWTDSKQRNVTFYPFCFSHRGRGTRSFGLDAVLAHST